MISPHCYQTEYEQKLCSFQEAVEVVRSGDVLEYGSFALFPYGLDEALAARAGSLDNIRIRTVTASCVPKAVLADPMGTHFVWNDWHYSGVGRKFQEAGSISFIPSSFHQSGKAVDLYEDCVCFIAASPMDCHGFFNVGVSNSFTQNCIKKARCIVIEENPSMPVCLGGYGESISISQVDRVVRGAPRPVLSVGNKEASPAEIRIAELIVDRIQNKSCVQLGIGALPNVIGKMLSQSKLRDLGVHTEMMVDAYVDMYEAGCITGKYKTTDPEKMVYTFALGTQRLYDFIDRNPSCASFPADYTNNPGVIARNDRTVSINNALEVDLYGQAASESSEGRQISGTGGQLDFAMGAFNSHEGQSFICLTSSFRDKSGVLRSRIVPHFAPGTVTTLPRSLIHCVATEYGVAQLKSLSVKDRTEALIGIAHPDFRETLRAEAKALHMLN